MKKSFRFRTLIIVLLFFSLIAYGIYQYFDKTKYIVEIDPGRLATVERSDIARSVVATGRIEPITKVEIKSKANGIIKELKVKVGDLVESNQVLAELDKENLIARVRESQAALMAAQSGLRASEAEYEKNKVEAENPEIVFVKRDFERAKKLFATGLIPQQIYDESQNALEKVENKQNVARMQLNVSKARVAEAEAAVEQAKAAVERANEELQNATIRAPIKGVVLSRDVEVGSPVSSILNLGASATLIMVLGDTSEVYVRGKVDESDIGLVQLNQPAQIRVESFKGKGFDGKVTQISPMGVEKDNVVSFEVRVSINNDAGILRTNMTANAEIILEERKSTLVIPESAIIYDLSRNAFVEIPDKEQSNGKKKILVKLGINNGNRTEVLQGLDEQQKVVLQ